MKNKKLFFIIFTLFLFIIILLSFTSISFGAEQKLVNTMNKAFEQIKDWLLKLATPAAAVAVGVGIFMKKFSFGDEERIRIGQKLIKSSLFSYAFILAIDLILSTIESFI